MTEPALNAERLWRRVQTLSHMTLPESPWTRRAFSPQFTQARTWLRDQFGAAGLSVQQDAAGNLIGRRAGHEPWRAPLITGSHCDTVVGGGRFDGIIGVLAGLEIAHTLQEQGVTLAHPLEVIDFLSEEPSDFGISCIGSRGFCGRLEPAMLQARDPSGQTLTDAMRHLGADPEALQQPLRLPGSTAAFVELHIEQGPVLETQALPIGVVTHIVGIQRVQITVRGQPDHAGTTPMDLRRDALVGAARLIDAAHRQASALSGQPHYVVATVGRLSLTPNVANAVPGQVEMMLEVRSDSRTVLDQFAATLMAGAQADLRALRLMAQCQAVSRSEPTDCSSMVMEATEAAAATQGYRSMRLPSGAGHDAVYVAPTGPVGLIFIPCLNGRSHCPEESITPQQLLDGTRVLYQTLLNLDQRLSGTPP